mmetsp:Transcript_58951/g.185019  ORF Transcript_58951/g.185019 Transcript_58951/m.185019 type:complete len:225 (-) Transcript_58951:5-679(-)
MSNKKPKSSRVPKGLRNLCEVGGFEKTDPLDLSEGSRVSLANCTKYFFSSGNLERMPWNIWWLTHRQSQNSRARTVAVRLRAPNRAISPKMLPLIRVATGLALPLTSTSTVPRCRKYIVSPSLFCSMITSPDRNTSIWRYMDRFCRNFGSRPLKKGTFCKPSWLMMSHTACERLVRKRGAFVGGATSGTIDSGAAIPRSKAGRSFVPCGSQSAQATDPWCLWDS